MPIQKNLTTDGFPPHRKNHRYLISALALTIAAIALPVTASTLEQAKRIHDRLAGAPPDAATLTKMQLAIQGGACGIQTSDLGNSSALGGVTPCSSLGAAYLAMSNKAFYNATLKNWISPWTNRDGNKFAPLNDYTATIIGVIRDGEDYRDILFANVLYVPNPSTYGAYSKTDNNAYAALEAADGDMSYHNNPQDLQKAASQSSANGLPSSAIAGVITSRAAARAFFIDGTNRAMFRFTLKNHLCHDMEDVQDTTRPTDRIRRDVSRSPGGDSRIFMNTCVGCHSGMDPMAQAFAYYNFSYPAAGSEDSGSLTYRAASNIAHDPTNLNKPATPNGTEKKYHINEAHFPEGFETLNEHWDNYWRSGPNTAIFGWSSSTGGSGDGASSMLKELAYSEAFAVCSVKKVFKVVCLRDPATSDQSAFTTMLNNFKSGYNLKHTFAEAAVYCSGS